MPDMDVELRVSGSTVARYELGEPRPYLHPISTLGGLIVSAAEPEDHRWHLGLSLAMQDVNGTNLWGGRTYVRGQGYTWLDDHGRISHEGFDSVEEDGLVQRLAWRNPQDEVLLRERRTITATPVGPTTWQLAVGWELMAPEKVVMGSPTTNGREYGAGYGGCFMRIAPGPQPLLTAGELSGEEEVNGCAESSVTWQAPGYRLRFEGAERWFVRTGIYPGVCSAWAFEEVRVIEAGQTWHGRMTVSIQEL